MLGVWVNFAAVVVGGLIGCLLKGGIKEKYRQTINYGLALCVFCIGVSGALATENMLVVIISVVLGSALGEWLRIEAGIERLGHWAQERFSRGGCGLCHRLCQCHAAVLRGSYGRGGFPRSGPFE